MCGELREQADKDMADTIIQISISNNKKTYERLKEENDMSQALEELMGDRLEKIMGDRMAARFKEGRAEGRREGWTEGRKEERANLLSRLQSSGMLTAEQIATVQNWRF